MTKQQEILLEQGRCIECRTRLTKEERDMKDGLCDICRQAERDQLSERKHPDDHSSSIIIGSRL